MLCFVVLFAPPLLCSPQDQSRLVPTRQDFPSPRTIARARQGNDWQNTAQPIFDFGCLPEAGPGRGPKPLKPQTLLKVIKKDKEFLEVDCNKRIQTVKATYETTKNTNHYTHKYIIKQSRS